VRSGPDRASPLRIATRSSRLAMAQARLVGDALPVAAELVCISTRGDRARGTLSEIGGKGLFTAELEAALRRGEVQLAVHSAKDLPAEISEETIIAAVPSREDARDAVVSADGAPLADLPRDARVGTSSLRRAAQALAIRPDLKVCPLRGNVETRLRKLREGECEAVILAMAGLNRLGLSGQLAGRVWPLPVEQFVPAAGQGALAVQCLAADRATREVLSAINDAQAAAALSAEREVVRRLGATCRSAVGVHIWPEGSDWRGVAIAADAGGERIVRADARSATARQAANDLHARLADAGAADVLAR